MYKVSVPQKNLVLECAEGKNLMDLLIENQLPVASSCHGEGICSKCAMKVTPKGELTAEEFKVLSRNKHNLDFRLCCQYHITENITVESSYW
jgi:ferredoxin, 2Fe-2S